MIVSREVQLLEHFPPAVQVHFFGKPWQFHSLSWPQVLSARWSLVTWLLRMDNLRGKFIVLDGPEGCGKSTQLSFLKARLENAGMPIVIAQDPGTTRVGEQLRFILLNPAHEEMAMRCEMFLYMASRAQLMSEVILPALDSNKIVVCDRFVSSTFAYQVNGENLSVDDIRMVAQIAIQGRWPDLTILLDMPAETAMRRRQRAKDRIEQRPIHYHERVRENFLSQASADPDHYRVISADRPQEAVHADIWKEISNL